MGLPIRLGFEELREVAAGSIGATYVGIGSRFEHPVRVLFLQNLTDTSLYFSIDGDKNYLKLPQDGYFVLDITANKAVDSGFYIAEGDRLYVKQDGIPSVGSVCLTVVYGDE